jgi:hypothetical protein
MASENGSVSEQQEQHRASLSEMEDLRKELMATHDTIRKFFRVGMSVYVCARVYVSLVYVCVFGVYIHIYD